MRYALIESYVAVECGSRMWQSKPVASLAKRKGALKKSRHYFTGTA
jgi:hypothetical protein